MKILVSLLVSMMIAVPVFAGVTYEKVNESTMRIIRETKMNVSRGQLLEQKANLERSIAEIDKLITEADKLGVTKIVESI